MGPGKFLWTQLGPGWERSLTPAVLTGFWGAWRPPHILRKGGQLPGSGWPFCLADLQCRPGGGMRPGSFRGRGGPPGCV